MGNEASQEAEVHAPIENNLEATWTHIALTGTNIPPREGHNVVAHNNKLYIFGGGGGDEQYNELVTVNLTDNVTSKVTTTGTTPSGRTGAAAQVVNGKIWIIGGLSTASRGWVNDVYCFDIEKNEWTFVVPEGERPSARDKLSSCVIGNKIYVIGGFGPRIKKAHVEGEEGEEDEDDEEEAEDEDDEMEEGEEEGEEGEEEEHRGAKVPAFDWFDDVLVFDTESRTWSTLTPTGTKPSARCAAGLSALDDTHIFLFGGRDAHQRKNDSFVLDLAKNEWTELNPRGRAPDARSFHTATRVPQGVLVYGGMSVNNAHFNDVHLITNFGEEGKQISWLQPSSTGTAPTARGFHTTTPVGSSIYVFGGSSAFDPELMCVTKFSNDLFKLDLAEKQQQQQPQTQ